MFEMLVECEPWDRFCARYSGVIGFFQLFDLEHSRNRYLPSNAPGTGPGDDDQFQLIFPPESRRMLPITVIHVGKSYVNWHRRVVERFDQPRVNQRERGGFDGRVHGRMAVVGYFPGNRARALFEQCERVDLVDHFQIHQPSGDPFIEADRSVLRELWAMETEELTQLHLLGPHSVRTLAMIPDGSLDALYLSGEVAPTWLVEALPHWLEKLKPGGIVFGELYGLPHWPEATHTICLLLGAPDGTAGDGSWWKRVGERLMLCPPLPKPDADEQAREQDGVLLVNCGKDSVERLLLTVNSVREHWSGPVRIYHWGEEVESLSIACCRLGIELCQVGREAWAGATGVLAHVAEIAAIQPYQRAILLQPGVVVLQPIDGIFGTVASGTVSSRDTASFRDAEPLFIGEGGICALPVVSALEFNGQGAIVTFTGTADQWTDAAWEAHSHQEASLASSMAAEVRVIADATIVSVVTPENAGDFQRNWLTWRFRGEPPVILVLAGISASDFWLPGKQRAPEILEVPPEHAGDACWWLEKVAGLCTTQRVLLLPAETAALPGAELWVDYTTADAAIHETAAMKAEEAITNNRFLSEPFFGMVSRRLLKEIVTSRAMRETTGEPLSISMREAMNETGAAVLSLDLSGKGWSWSQTLRFWPRRQRKLIRALRETHCGLRMEKQLKHLAEDVVVISLPERTDRRERVQAMMERESVAFRFVEGVRVTYEEVRWEEVAEVSEDDYKKRAGWEKYLCGMVGCRRAHLRCLQDAFDAGRRSLVIFEDDFAFVDGWSERLPAALAELPTGWLQLYFSAVDFVPRTPVSSHLRRLGGAYHTTAILYSEAGIEAALECVRRSRKEIDNWMGKHLHPSGGSYVVYPRITYQTGGTSDITSLDREDGR